MVFKNKLCFIIYMMIFTLGILINFIMPSFHLYKDLHYPYIGYSDFKIPDNTKNNIPNSSSKLVVIDAGHGGSESGAIHPLVIEKNINLDVALKLNMILQKYHINTIMTRNSDTFIALKDRVDIANMNNANLFVSIHCDWFGNSSIKGTSILYNPNNNSKKHKLTNLEFAKIIYNRLPSTLGMSDKRLVDRFDLAVLNHTKMPSILIELGFLSNPNDLQSLYSNNFQQEIAKYIASGIIRALEKN